MASRQQRDHKQHVTVVNSERRGKFEVALALMMTRCAGVLTPQARVLVATSTWILRAVVNNK